ncbi:MAG: PQQ-dependent sugar dehydrogenase [Pseudomonadota bacterium]
MKKRFYLVFAFIIGVLMSGCTATLVPDQAVIIDQSRCCQLQPQSVEVSTEVVVEGLDRPWGFVFLPDDSILVTERPGSLRRIADGAVSEPLAGVPDVADINQGGLLDIVLDPDFDKTRQVFFTYAVDDGSGYGTAVARARLNLEANRLDNLETIFSSNIKSSGGRHFGSRLRFSSDKTLLVTLGDRGDPMRAQDPFDHAGSVIRINRDGSAPVDNPFADGKEGLPEIWSIGHRNPQGAAVHPLTGEYWTLSHGDAGGDEVNRPKAGLNFGWPIISYGTKYSGAGFPEGAAAPGYEQPVYYWDPSIAPSGLEFYVHDNPLIPEWNGSLMVGALAGRHLSRLSIQNGRVVREEQYFENEFGRIRDIRTGPDGALWMITDSSSGQLIRVTGR